MKVIVAGSRSIQDDDFVAKAIADSGFEITEIVSGRAMGVDRSGEWWAIQHGIKLTYFPADWNTFGRRAGFMRNWDMAKYSDALVAICAEQSRGTTHMVKTAREQGLKVFVVEYNS